MMKKETTLKLHYFTRSGVVIRGRAEIIRLVLAYSKREYTFEPIDLETENYKEILEKKFMYAQLPVLEIDGVSYSQSLGIASFLAQDAGINGSNALEELAIDQLAQLREDLLMKEIEVFKEPDTLFREEELHNLQTEMYPRYLGYFTKTLKNMGREYAVGNKFTLADIVLYEGTTTVSQSEPELFAKFPELVAHRQKIENIPELRDYIQNRERTDI